jgi:hypothetical protein
VQEQWKNDLNVAVRFDVGVVVESEERLPVEEGKEVVVSWSREAEGPSYPLGGEVKR